MFRSRFWFCLLLTVPVLLYSHMLQMWFGFTMPGFPGSQWIWACVLPVLSFSMAASPFCKWRCLKRAPANPA